MNFYLTSGTADFLQSLLLKHTGQQLYLLQGNEKALLLHETEGKSIFSLPKKYVVALSHGQLQQSGFYSLHHLAGDSSNRDLLVEKLKSSAATLQNDGSIRAFRLLSPKKKTDAVIFLTHWSGPHSYEAWLQSEAYQTHFAAIFTTSTASVQKIFDGENYVATYFAQPLNE